MKIQTIALVAACTALLGCRGEQPEGGTWAGTLRDSAGISIVENPSNGTWTDEMRWQVEEVLRIGSVEGDPNYQFAQITGMAVTDDAVFVLDARAAEVRVFDNNGEYLRTIGKPGSGPGEIGAAGFAGGAAALVNGPGDTLLVADMGNTRVLRFLESGADVGSYRVDMQNGIPTKWSGTQDGPIVVQRRPFAFPGQNTSVDSMDVIVTLDNEGTATDTLLRTRSGETFSMSGGRFELKIFSPEPMWTLAQNGRIFQGVNSEYRVNRYGTNGELELIVAKPFQREAVEEIDKEVITEAFEKNLAQAELPPAALDQFRNALGFDDYLPVYTQIMAGMQGTLWVQHYRRPSEMSSEELENFNPQVPSGPPDWDVFDTDGRYLGVVTFVPKFTPVLFLKDRVYGVWRDELDVQHVLAFQVTGQAS